MRCTLSRSGRPLISPRTLLPLAALLAAGAGACSDDRSISDQERYQFSTVTTSMAKVMALDPQAVARLGAVGFVAGSPASTPRPVTFDFDDDCLSVEESELSFNECADQLGGTVQGSVRLLGDRLRGNLLYVSSEGTDSQDTTLTIGSNLDLDVTYDGTFLDGSMTARVAGLLTTEGYNVRGTLTFTAVELDDEACPVGGTTSLDVAGAYSGFGYVGTIELTFGPACGDVEGVVTGDLAISSGGQDTTGAGNGGRINEQGEPGSGS